MKYRLGLTSSLVSLISNFKYHDICNWLSPDLGKYVKKSVLDVGCGSGSLLKHLKDCGFTNLTGIDPFLIKEEIRETVSLFRTEIADLNSTYDLIMFHHSFEHMYNPHKIFEKLSTLLNENGLLLIRIPVVDSYSWRKYGTSWLALDAPRHFFLHTVKSMNYLVEEYGFVIDKVLYDSTWQQFYFSESYIRNIGLNECFKEFSKKAINKFQKQSDFLNEFMDGDQACFYIKRKSLVSIKKC